MLHKIKKILEKKELDNKTGVSNQLAVSALMVEAAMMDGKFTNIEKSTILRLLIKYFDLSEEEGSNLLDEANTIQDSATQIIRFTRAITDGYSDKDRVAIIEMIWEVVLADGIEDDFEKNLMRRIAGLIYVSDQDSGAARKRVKYKLASFSSS